MPIILPNRSKSKDNGVDKQVSNLQKRLGSVGIEDTDSRNWFEKITNLPQKQNAFFDTLDLLQRPAQAVSNVFDNAVTEKKSMGAAALDGLTGKNKVRYSEILDKLGVENKYTKAIGGFGLDVALDPLTYVPASAIAKGFKMGAKGVNAVLPEVVKKGVGKVKTAADNVFNPNAPYKKTLAGNDSTELINIKRNTTDLQRYHSEKSINDVLQATKAVGGDLNKGVDVTNFVEKDLGGVSRTASQDAGVHEAARQISNSYASIRSLASSVGITIDDQAGYMKRILTEEAEKFRGRGSSGKSRIGGNKNEVKARQYGDMTTEEFNAMKKDNSALIAKIDARIASGKTTLLNGNAMKQKIIDQTPTFNTLEPNAFFSTAKGQQRLINMILAEDAKFKILGNADFARKVPRGKNPILQDGEELIDTANYQFMNAATGQIGNSSQKYVVTKGARKLLENYKVQSSDEGLKSFNTFYDKIQNTFKKFALFSAGFHIRNDIGAKFNMHIAGMPLPKIASEWAGAIKTSSLAKKAEASIRTGAALTPEESAAFLTYDAFKKQGLKESGMLQHEFTTGTNDNIQKVIEKKAKTGMSKVADKVKSPFETSREAGVATDEFNRLAYFSYLKKSGMSDKDSAAKVREVLYDYADLSQTDKQLRRFMPFYTWTRKNIPFQLKNLALKPAKYTAIDKGIDTGNEMTGVDESTLPDWLKESFAVPVSGDGEGNGKFANLTLPLSDLTKAAHPLKLLSSSLTPLIKAPIELASNFDTFRGKPISSFEGEKEKMFGVMIPKKIAYAIKQLGAIRNASGYTNSVVEGDMEALVKSIQSGGILKEHDADKAKLNKLYEQLESLQDAAKKYKQDTGNDLPTIADLGKRGIFK